MCTYVCTTNLEVYLVFDLHSIDLKPFYVNVLHNVHLKHGFTGNIRSSEPMGKGTRGWEGGWVGGWWVAGGTEQKQWQKQWSCLCIFIQCSPVKMPMVLVLTHVPVYSTSSLLAWWLPKTFQIYPNKYLYRFRWIQ